VVQGQVMEPGVTTRLTCTARSSSDSPFDVGRVQTAMDRSSSPAYPTSLPPSSAPDGTSSQPQRRTRPSTDALALDDVASEAGQDEAGPSRRRPTRARGALNNDVQPVRDQTGESVAAAFEEFLKT
jgi:hypothetical protein